MSGAGLSRSNLVECAFDIDQGRWASVAVVDDLGHSHGRTTE